jgi:hypothetical protein
MSRRLLLAAVVLLGGAGVGNGAVVFEPSVVPGRECSPQYSRLNARYQRQLEVLNMYSARAWVQVPASAYGERPPVIDLLQQPCGETNNYYRKGDLMPVRVERAGVRPVGVRGVVGGQEKGTILIFPKRLMDRPVREFEKGDVGRALSRAE